MLDLSPIASAIRMLQQPPPQVMPLVAKVMKPVRDSEIPVAVPPPAKSGRAGLGQHMDLYDTDAEAKPAASDPAREEDTAFPLEPSEKGSQVPDAPPPIELPFLKPLGPPLGKAFDARV